MNHYIAALLVGLACYVGFALWCVYYLLKTANDEDPGCISPNRH